MYRRPLLASLIVLVALYFASHVTRAEGAESEGVEHPWVKCSEVPKTFMFYPDKARRHEVLGSAQIQCRFGSSGDPISCTWISEDPPSWGFGATGAKIGCLMHAGPERFKDAPPEGALLTTPVNFQFPPKTK